MKKLANDKEGRGQSWSIHSDALLGFFRLKQAEWKVNSEKSNFDLRNGGPILRHHSLAIPCLRQRCLGTVILALIVKARNWRKLYLSAWYFQVQLNFTVSADVCIYHPNFKTLATISSATRWKSESSTLIILDNKSLRVKSLHQFEVTILPSIT